MFNDVAGPARAPLKSVRVMIADDHDVVCAGLERLLAREPGIQVCATASSGREAIDLAIRHSPDVAILDIDMGEMSGIDAAREIRAAAPGCEVVLFTGIETDELMRKAFVNGAKSFILKTDARNHLLEAVRALSQHKTYFTSKVSNVVFSRLLERPTRNAPDLVEGSRMNSRELELLRRLAIGESNREVADAMHLNLRTIEGHRAALMKKMKFDSLADLVKYAVRNGIVEL
jgi:DNA-binding NarL/FixJ family response regulator